MSSSSIMRLLRFATVWVVSCGALWAAQTEGPISLLDLDGKNVTPLESSDAAVHVFVFTRVDCPISNRYAPELSRIHARYADQGVAFWLVYPDPDSTAESIRAHLNEYDYAIPALRDPEHHLVDRSEAKITPEAVVVNSDRDIVYVGRIDNRFVTFGRTRPKATRNDLDMAIAATLAGEAVEVARTEAVGCFISDLK